MESWYENDVKTNPVGNNINKQTEHLLMLMVILLLKKHLQSSK